MSPRLSAFLLPALLLFALPASARDLDLPGVLARADVVVLARVSDPPATLVNVAIARAKNGAAVAPYPRYIRHFTVVQTLRAPAAWTVGRRLDIDEPDWRARLEAHRRCRGEDTCAPFEGDAYVGELAREPVPGHVILAFLHRTKDGGLELAAERSLDSAERAAQVRALLPAVPKR